MGAGSSMDTFVVVQAASGWMVDNDYCAGRPATTVYGPLANTPCTG